MFRIRQCQRNVSLYNYGSLLKRQSKDVGVLTPVFLKDIASTGNIKYLENLCAVCEQIRTNPIWYQKESQANKLKMLQIYQISLMYAANTNQIYLNRLEQQSAKIQYQSVKVRDLRSDILNRKRRTDHLKKLIRKKKVDIERKKTEKYEQKLRQLKQQVRNRREAQNDDDESQRHEQSQPQVIYIPVPFYQNHINPLNQTFDIPKNQNYFPSQGQQYMKLQTRNLMPACSQSFHDAPHPPVPPKGDVLQDFDDFVVNPVKVVEQKREENFIKHRKTKNNKTKKRKYSDEENDEESNAYSSVENYPLNDDSDNEQKAMNESAHRKETMKSSDKQGGKMINSVKSEQKKDNTKVQPLETLFTYKQIAIKSDSDSPNYNLNEDYLSSRSQDVQESEKKSNLHKRESLPKYVKLEKGIFTLLGSEMKQSDYSSYHTILFESLMELSVQTDQQKSQVLYPNHQKILITNDFDVIEIPNSSNMEHSSKAKVSTMKRSHIISPDESFIDQQASQKPIEKQINSDSQFSSTHEKKSNRQLNSESEILRKSSISKQQLKAKILIKINSCEPENKGKIEFSIDVIRDSIKNKTGLELQELRADYLIQQYEKYISELHHTMELEEQRREMEYQQMHSGQEIQFIELPDYKSKIHSEQEIQFIELPGQKSKIVSQISGENPERLSRRQAAEIFSDRVCFQSLQLSRKDNHTNVGKKQSESELIGDSDEQRAFRVARSRSMRNLNQKDSLSF